MQINLFNNNKSINTERSKNTSSVNFGHNKLIKIKINKETTNNISAVAELYDNILSIFSKLNGPDQNKFKSLFPSLIAGEKKKGFVFNGLTKNKNHRLQIVRYNSKPNSNELLTFDLLNQENQNLTRYRVSKQGDVLISSNKNNIEINPNSDDSLEKITKEFENLDIYSQNFRQINKKINYNPNKTVNELISNIQETPSNILKDKISETNEIYNNLNIILNKGKDAATLKKNYFGENTDKIKGLVFKNVDTNETTYNFCPMQSKNDDRTFRIFIQDKNDNIQKSLLFFSDGKIAKVRDNATDLKDFRPHNIEFISDKEVENLNIENILETLNNKFKDFENFVVQEKNNQKQSKIVLRETNKQEKIEKVLQAKTQRKEEKAKIKLEKTQAKEKEKLEAKQRAKQLKEERAKLKEHEKQRKKAEERALLEENFADLKVARQQKIAEKHAALLKSNTTEEEQIIQNIEKNISTKKIPEFTSINLTETVEALDNIFLKPIEKRSPHLVHEKLSNGNIFAGRFRLESSDGATIIVKRVKSPKYVDFTYYSIDIEKNNKKYTLNIDPEMNRIIHSTDDGKPIISGKCMAVYDSKREFLEKYPDAKNIPLYLSEIFETRNDVPRTTIKFISPQNIKKEQENKIISEILSQAE